MPEWEEWSCGTGDQPSEFQFPRLHQLSIYKCQKLAKVSSLSLPYLHELDLHECSKVILHSFKHLNLLTYLKLESVTGFTCISRDLMQYTEKLEALEICNCDEFISLWEHDVSTESLTCLKRLVVEDCSNIVCLGDEDQQLPLNLEVLEIFGCPTLSSLPLELSKLKNLREIIIKTCPKLVSFPETGVPPMLRRLLLQGCNALNSLPNGLSNLERLELKDCSSLRAWSESSFPTTFKKVVIINVEHLEPVSDKIFEQNRSMSLAELNISNWENVGTLLRHMHCFSHLAELHISHCETLESFPQQGLPTPNLRILSIEYCSQLKSTPSNIHRISSLVSLEIRGCSNLETFPQANLPSSLTSLRIWDSRKLRPLAEWKLDRLTSLKELSICGGFSKHDSFADDENLFPSSITRFSIARFKNLKSLSKCLDRLTSLQHLSLMTCPKLKTLPNENILNGLWRLEISNCKKLKDQCMKDGGDYWSKIANIPCVEIDVNERNPDST
ncbi:OLC1v1001380C2 [Oldenlandia corymbosa var. corymbosa]|uniref:OLC1v1001380C2 n=1 Tax=Oldenlandia corymbosa var. corymbosa TaxID=529605 RepID=A0AAV1D686_OLDCO|nr:OLC1v1001380C2 [Oldenlandia corymbosa var. corymbosa]